MIVEDVQAEARTRRQMVRAWAVAAVLLVPLFVMLWLSAKNAVEHKSAYDWEANHRTKQRLHNNALLLTGVPIAGTLLGAVVATSAGRRSGLGAARGAMWAAIGLWATIFVMTFIALRNFTLS